MTADSPGNWLARAFNSETGKQAYQPLGEFDRIPSHERFDAAVRDASTWFRHVGLGGNALPSTVRSACESYVEHVRDARGDAAAKDLQSRFDRWVYSNATFADTELPKLTKARVDAWRKALAKTPAQVSRDGREVPVTRTRSSATVNREIAALRAALNHAHDADAVTSNLAWRVTLRSAPNTEVRRDAYLDREQRALLIKSASADVGLFLKGLALLPLRPGALAALTVGSFDQHRRVLTVGKDKAGQDRRIMLPPETAKFLATAQTNKLPAAPLFARADGKAWDKDAWKKPVKNAVLAAGLPSTITAYALRHSAITDLVIDGLDLLTVARISGTSVAMIERHYGHLRAEHAAAGLAKLAL